MIYPTCGLLTVPTLPAVPSHNIAPHIALRPWNLHDCTTIQSRLATQVVIHRSNPLYLLFSSECHLELSAAIDTQFCVISLTLGLQIKAPANAALYLILQRASKPILDSIYKNVITLYSHLNSKYSESKSP